MMDRKSDNQTSSRTTSPIFYPSYLNLENRKMYFFPISLVDYHSIHFSLVDSHFIRISLVDYHFFSKMSKLQNNIYVSLNENQLVMTIF